MHMTVSCPVLHLGLLYQFKVMECVMTSEIIVWGSNKDYDSGDS